MNNNPGNDPRSASKDLDAAFPTSLAAAYPPAMTVPGVATPLASAERPGTPPATVFRVVRRDGTSTAFAAQENRNGGRWTSEGVPAAYAAKSAAGALLEFLAHLEGASPEDLVLVSATLPGDSLLIAESLPSQWRERPYREDVRAYGDEWARSQRTLALELPSVLCESESNVLINPEHPEFSGLKIAEIEPLTIDPRLRY